jgi:FtsP/CotA-like multicopper oxidase with cupredoxin domain
MSNSRKIVTVAVAITVIVALIALVTGVVPIPQPSQPSSSLPSPATITKSTCDRPPGFILIIADLSGFNNSMRHGAPTNPWPVIQVHQGDVVSFLVCNKDTTQPHGFAIQTYLDSGVILAPGDAYRIVFTATVPGSFKVYCNIFCTVHIFMVGRLIVTE